MLDGNFVLRRFEQIRPVDLLLAAAGQQLQLVLVEEIPQAGPFVVALTVLELLLKQQIEVVVRKMALIREREAHPVPQSLLQFRQIHVATVDRADGVAELRAAIIRTGLGQPEHDEDKPFDLLEGTDTLTRIIEFLQNRHQQRAKIRHAQPIQALNPFNFFPRQIVRHLRVERAEPVNRRCLEAFDVVANLVRPQFSHHHRFAAFDLVQSVLVVRFQVRVRCLLLGFLQFHRLNDLAMDTLRCELLLQQKLDVVSPRLPRELEIHHPVGPQKVVVVQRLRLVAPQLEVNLLPSVVD